jgi:hypothetical protein
MVTMDVMRAFKNHGPGAVRANPLMVDVDEPVPAVTAPTPTPNTTQQPALDLSQSLSSPSMMVLGFNEFPPPPPAPLPASASASTAVERAESLVRSHTEVLVSPDISAEPTRSTSLQDEISDAWSQTEITLKRDNPHATQDEIDAAYKSVSDTVAAERLARKKKQSEKAAQLAAHQKRILDVGLQKTLASKASIMVPAQHEQAASSAAKRKVADAFGTGLVTSSITDTHSIRVHLI